MSRFDRTTARTPSYLLPVVAAAAVGACSPTISALHTPLYSGRVHTSTIEARARASLGVVRIRILVTTGGLADCGAIVGSGMPAALPCRKNATSVVHTCDYPDHPSDATCVYAQPLASNALVSYSATVESRWGGSASAREIWYAGGTLDPPAWIARPVWWQQGAPLAGRLDLAFFPHTDYADYPAFADSVTTLAGSVFFAGSQPVSGSYRQRSESFNLWAGPPGADATSLGFDTNTSSVASLTEGEAILHTTNFPDKAKIGLGGTGSVDAGATDAAWVLVHESGHFLFAQGDEYPGGAHFTGDCGNVFATAADCQAALPAPGGPPATCVPIGASVPATDPSGGASAYRATDGSLETMADRNAASDWRDHSRHCVMKILDACKGGSCY